MIQLRVVYKSGAIQDVFFVEMITCMKLLLSRTGRAADPHQQRAARLTRLSRASRVRLTGCTLGEAVSSASGGGGALGGLGGTGHS